MRPRILISCSNDGGKNYSAAVEAAGGEACLFYLPPADDSYDALLLAGGEDVEPWRFGQENNGSEEPDVARDEAEFALMEKYLAAGKPILGICRGHQVINVALGGTLIQHIGDDLCLFHRRGEIPDDRIHPIRTEEGGFVRELLGAETLLVNSSHHQAVDKPGEGLRVVAWSESGLVEAIEHESLPIRGVQWHPERISYGKRRPEAVGCEALFDWFIAAAQKRKEN